MSTPAYTVRSVSRDECSDFILNIHYAKRWPSISYAFGLFRDGELVGVVTYGTPPSSTLRVGVAGKENSGRVIELNRLVLRDNLKNEASRLISRSIKMLPRGLFVVSYADTSKGHCGYVYQATNFRYYGLSAKRSDWSIRGKEHLHSQTLTDEFRGQPNRAKLVREKYGDDFQLVDRPRKHRYIYCTDKREYSKIKYKEESYPKSGTS